MCKLPGHSYCHHKKENYFVFVSIIIIKLVIWEKLRSAILEKGPGNNYFIIAVIVVISVEILESPQCKNSNIYM